MCFLEGVGRRKDAGVDGRDDALDDADGTGLLFGRHDAGEQLDLGRLRLAERDERDPLDAQGPGVYGQLEIIGQVTDHLDLFGEFQTAMGKWIAERRIKWRETVVEGIENALRAFIGLFKGENLGKMLVKIGPDPVA